MILLRIVHLLSTFSLINGIKYKAFTCPSVLHLTNLVNNCNIKISASRTIVSVSHCITLSLLSRMGKDVHIPQACRSPGTEKVGIVCGCEGEV